MSRESPQTFNGKVRVIENTANKGRFAKFKSFRAASISFYVDGKPHIAHIELPSGDITRLNLSRLTKTRQVVPPSGNRQAFDIGGVTVNVELNDKDHQRFFHFLLQLENDVSGTNSLSRPVESTATRLNSTSSTASRSSGGKTPANQLVRPRSNVPKLPEGKNPSAVVGGESLPREEEEEHVDLVTHDTVVPTASSPRSSPRRRVNRSHSDKENMGQAIGGWLGKSNTGSNQSVTATSAGISTASFYSNSSALSQFGIDHFRPPYNNRATVDGAAKRDVAKRLQKEITIGQDDCYVNTKRRRKDGEGNFGGTGFSDIDRIPPLSFETRSSTLRKPLQSQPSTSSAYRSTETTTRSRLQPELSYDTTSTGFSNLGNSCYQNVVLQALLGMEGFSRELWHISRKLQDFTLAEENDDDVKLFHTLVDLLQCKSDSASDSMKRRCLVDIKQTMGRGFSDYSQEDANEFLTALLDRVKSGVKTLMSRAPTCSGAALLNPVDSNFGFTLRRSYICEGCKHSVTKDAEYLDIQAALPSEQRGGCSVQDVLNSFLEPETIEYKCENCSSGRSIVQNLFLKAPRTLILTVKRYEYDRTSNRRSKRHSTLEIPKYISIKDYCDRTTSDANPITASARKASKFLSSKASVDGDVSLPPTAEKPPMSPSFEDSRMKTRKRLFPAENQSSPVVAQPTTSTRFDDIHPKSEMESEAMLQEVLEMSRLEHERKKQTNGVDDGLQITMRNEDVVEDSLDDDEHSPPNQWTSIAPTADNLPLTPRSVKKASPILFADESGDFLEVVGESKEVSPIHFEPVGHRWQQSRAAFCLRRQERAVVSPLATEDKAKLMTHRDKPSDASIISILPDGNCLFRAVSYWLTGNEGNNHVELRQKTIDFMRENQKYFKTFLEKDENFDKYLKRMSSPSEWGGTNEILALSTLLQTKIYTYLRDGTWHCYPPLIHIGGYNDSEADLKRAIFLVNTDNHYEPVLDVHSSHSSEEMRRQRLEELRAEYKTNYKTGHLPFSYRLAAVVNHIGLTSGSGHYVCDVWRRRGADDGDEEESLGGSGEWRECDDSAVRPTKENKVLQSRTQTGYMYFYVSKAECSSL